MDRLISEQAVIDAVSEWLYDKTRKESIETVIKAIPSAEPRYCDRNICLRNEYNGIGCDECEVTKSKEPACDTCEYNSAAFNPCNACKDKSEYEPQKVSDKGWVNLAEYLIPILDEAESEE